MLKNVEGRIVVQIDMEHKNSHMFSDGTKIALERRYDCFDRKYTEPVNAIVVSANAIPEGAEILVHHNSTHETNRIYSYTSLSGNEIASNIRYFSIPESEAFAWRKENEWLPLPGFDFGLRVFKPYHGLLDGIEPTLIKDILFITTGNLKNKACVTLKASDYQLIYQDVNGREGNLIRLRSSPNEKEKRDAEIVAIHHEYTDKVLSGELFVGLTKEDAKPLKTYMHA